MNTRIAVQRLENQRLTRQGPRDPGDLVAWFGAVQAQDYPAAKWALALGLAESVARYGRFLEMPISVSGAASGGGRAVRDRPRTS